MKEKLEYHFIKIMEILGLDLNDDSLSGTPKRLAKLYGDEVFSGLKEETFPRIVTIENKFNVDEMVAVKNVIVNSTCEHHFLPFFGKAIVAYIPDKKIIGLSKINRIVQYYSKRPQVQERLTRDIMLKLQELLGTKNVAVKIEALHTCVKTRGVQDETSQTLTTMLGGVFKEDHKARNEFLIL